MSIRYALGNLVASIDRFDGSTVNFDYDTGARLTRARYPDGDDLAFTYQACGRPATASNAVSQIAWSYDGAGRQTNETCSIPGLSSAPSALSVALDASGLPTNSQLSVQSLALSVKRSFDPAARLTTQATEAGLFSWHYTSWNGLPAAITNATSGIYATYEYDILDRPTNIVWRTAAGNLLTRFGYAYNAASLITNRVIARAALPVMNAAYSYDLLDRLTAEVTNGVGVTTTYDLAGNRLVRGGVTNSYASVNGQQTDRLASTSDGAAYLYDAAGCVTNISFASFVVDLSWNSRYQLAAAYTNGIPAESYTYDSLSRRVSTTTGGTITYHVYDGNWQVLADLDANGTPLRSYTWAPGIDHLLAITVYTPDPEQTNSLQSTHLFPVTDHQGTVHALVDDTGSIVESYDYDAWGNVMVYDDSRLPIPESQYGNRYLFQGREYSLASGLYYFRARWYDPKTGRWLSNDPIGISGGMNQYLSFQSDPVGITDGFGTKPGDPYNDPDSAAIDALKSIYPLSTTHEHGGIIYSKEGKYYATAPVEKSNSGISVNVEAVSDATIIGDYHSHQQKRPWYQTNYIPNRFSTVDFDGWVPGTTRWMICANGTIMRMRARTKEEDSYAYIKGFATTVDTYNEENKEWVPERL